MNASIRCALLLSCLTACGGDHAASAGSLQVAVIPKGTTHEFWKAVHAGAEKAASELGVTALWKGPNREDDRADQIEIVESFVAKRVDAIVLAPLDNRALVPAVELAHEQEIPVVIIDSDIEWQDRVSFVATDNYQGGVLAARRLGQLISGGGRVLVLRYQEGSASTMNRESGFLDTLAGEFPDVEVVSSNQYAGATAETAMKKAEGLLLTFPDVDGIFCPNESSTFGMLRALQEKGLAGSLRFVGFDSSDKLVAGLRAGEMDGLVLQNPFRMGYEGVIAAVRSLRGESVEGRIDTGVTIATPENLDREEIQELLRPR